MNIHKTMIFNQLSFFNCFLITFLVSLSFLLISLHVLEDSSDASALTIREVSNRDYSKLEITKRIGEVRESVNELWFYLNNEFKKLLNPNKSNVSQVLLQLSHYKNAILDNFANANQVENDVRVEQLNKLSETIQNNLHVLQNPRSCDSAKKIICKVSVGCGFGCAVHHLQYCLITAYAMNRTLVLDYRGKGFGNFWLSWFEPISSCSYNSSQHAVNWMELDYPLECQTSNLVLPEFLLLKVQPDFAPLAIPRQIGPTLSRLHGYPFLWWTGQFIKYLLTPTKRLNELIDKRVRELKFERPIVGIHIRRTDKKREAKYYEINEYMEHAEEFFDHLQMKKPNIKRRVYLASDEVQIFQEAKKRYPEYTFIGDPNIAKTAVLEKRKSNESIIGIILDIYFLQHSDFLVCTFSSNVGRLAFTLMQTLHTDATFKVRSVDTEYYYFAAPLNDLQAILSHSPSKGEIELRVGDSIKSSMNFHNGYCTRTNRRTGKSGLFPLYKVRDVVRYADFGNYSYPNLTVS